MATILITDGPAGFTLIHCLFGLIGTAWAIFINVGLAREIGPAEIRDTLWACLELT